MSSKPQQVSFYEIKITLIETEPTVWRRVMVPRDITLACLHEVIQIAMGWDDDHLHDFAIGRKRYAPLMESSFRFGDAPVNEDIVRLNGVAKPKAKFLYTYDFGDSWRHEIQIEREIVVQTEQRQASCIAGENACPPEDCGGTWGYSGMVAIIADPQHEHYEETMERVGDDFDPRRFDLAEADRRLALLPV